MPVDDEEVTFAPIDHELLKEIQFYLSELQRWRTTNRTRAENHLKRIGAPALPYLLPAARHPTDFTRRAIMRILQGIGGEDVISVALEALNDTDVFVRQTASEMLRHETSRDFGFRASASDRARQRALRRWEKFIFGEETPKD